MPTPVWLQSDAGAINPDQWRASARVRDMHGNSQRAPGRGAGLPPHKILPGAYEPCEEGELGE